MNVGTVLEKHLDGFLVAAADGMHQRRPPVVVANADVDFLTFVQKLPHRIIPASRRPGQ